MKLTDLPARDPDASRSDGAVVAQESNALPKSRSVSTLVDPGLRKLSVDQLSQRLDDPTAQSGVLDELCRRASLGNGGTSSDIAEHKDAIVSALKDGDESARASAARLLGLVRCADAVPQLIDALEDTDPQVRVQAAAALARITRQTFGPGQQATPGEAKRAIARWRQWWSKQSSPAER
jgi:hypothetical protein